MMEPRRQSPALQEEEFLQSEPGVEGGSCLSWEACNSTRSLHVRDSHLSYAISVNLRICLRRWILTTIMPVLWLRK